MLNRRNSIYDAGETLGNTPYVIVAYEGDNFDMVKETSGYDHPVFEGLCREDIEVILQRMALLAHPEHFLTDNGKENLVFGDKCFGVQVVRLKDGSACWVEI